MDFIGVLVLNLDSIDSTKCFTDFNEGDLLEQLGIKSINIDFSDFSNQLYAQTILFKNFCFALIRVQTFKNKFQNN